MAGKPKSEIINLLFEDVKSVISDSGKQYQIWSIFSTYKQIPDENFITQTDSSNDSKAAVVANLANVTFETHPYIRIDEQISNLPKTKDIKDGEEIAKKQRFQLFDDALKVNKNLTNRQKAFVKTNYERLNKDIDTIIKPLVSS